MKLNDTLMYGLLAFGGVVLAIFFVYNRFIQQTEAEAKAALNEWVENMMAVKLANKVSASPDAVRKVLAQTNRTEVDGELWGKVRALIDRVEVVFTQRSVSSVTRSLEAQLTDGTAISITSRMQWDALPGNIRSQFISAGKKSIRIPWTYASANSQTLGAKR